MKMVDMEGKDEKNRGLTFEVDLGFCTLYRQF